MASLDSSRSKAQPHRRRGDSRGTKPSGDGIDETLDGSGLDVSQQVQARGKIGESEHRARLPVCTLTHIQPKGLRASIRPCTKCPYPVIFRASDLVVLSKTDLVPLLDDFDPLRAARTVGLQALNPCV